MAGPSRASGTAPEPEQHPSEGPGAEGTQEAAGGKGGREGSATGVRGWRGGAGRLRCGRSPNRSCLGTDALAAVQRQSHTNDQRHGETDF